MLEVKRWKFPRHCPQHSTAFAQSEGHVVSYKSATIITSLHLQRISRRSTVGYLGAYHITTLHPRNIEKLFQVGWRNDVSRMLVIIIIHNGTASCMSLRKSRADRQQKRTESSRRSYAGSGALLQQMYTTVTIRS